MKSTCRCAATWNGTTVAHCAGCHHTFTRVSTFDQHQTKDGCQDPASRGLVKNQRGHWGMAGGYWGADEDGADQELPGMWEAADLIGGATDAEEA